MTEDAGTARPGAPEPPTKASTRLRAFLRALILVPTVVTVLLYLLQEVMLFPGAYGLADDPAERARIASGVGARPGLLTTPSGEAITVWHFPASGSRLVIYVGGNYEPIEASTVLARALVPQGWDLLAIAPRGWPGSEGPPGEQAFHDDVVTAWQHATTTLGVPPHRIVLHGRSIGGGAIGTVIDELTPAGAVFESTFDSVVPLAQGVYPFLPVRWLLKHRFDTVARAPHAAFPVLQIHSTDDEVIPIGRARTLAATWVQGTWIEVSGFSHQHTPLLSDPAARRRWSAWLDATVPPDVP